MKPILRKILFGDADIKEYATVTIDNGIKEKVYLKINARTVEVSQNHWLLCLDPIVFGVWMRKDEQNISLSKEDQYKMYFTNSFEDLKKIEKNAVADLSLDFVDQILEKDGILVLFKLKKSKIYHINYIKSHLLFLKFYKKPQVSFAKLKSFVSAYSYPRKVRVISFKQDDYYNIFPMDLLGAIPESNKYVFGLRHTNTALSKIMETKKLVVSEVSAEHKNLIYKLGSHHSASPPPVEQLPFKVINSSNFNFYVPEWADSYKEIQILKTINLGSHMLLFGEVLHESILKTSKGNLFHIHYLLYLYQKRKGSLYPQA